MAQKFRCNCPVTSVIDLLGDKWILVIIKQMLLQRKKTFKDFLNSEESIATNILTNKLKTLTDLKIITKKKVLNNKKSFHYFLTEKGLSLAPTIIELLIWGEENIRQIHPEMKNLGEFSTIKTDKNVFIASLQNKYLEFVTNQNN